AREAVHVAAPCGAVGGHLGASHTGPRWRRAVCSPSHAGALLVSANSMHRACAVPRILSCGILIFQWAAYGCSLLPACACPVLRASSARSARLLARVASAPRGVGGAESDRAWRQHVFLVRTVCSVFSALSCSGSSVLNMCTCGDG